MVWEFLIALQPAPLGGVGVDVQARATCCFSNPGAYCSKFCAGDMRAAPTTVTTLVRLAGRTGSWRVSRASNRHCCCYTQNSITHTRRLLMRHQVSKYILYIHMTSMRKVAKQGSSCLPRVCLLPEHRQQTRRRVALKGRTMTQAPLPAPGGCPCAVRVPVSVLMSKPHQDPGWAARLLHLVHCQSSATARVRILVHWGTYYGCLHNCAPRPGGRRSVLLRLLLTNTQCCSGTTQ